MTTITLKIFENIDTKYDYMIVWDKPIFTLLDIYMEQV